MMQCQDIRSRMAFYLDDELHNGERTDFEAHLSGCPACHSLCEQERRELESIRALQPLYSAPPELRTRMAALLNETPEPYRAPSALRDRLQQMLWPRPQFSFFQRPTRALAFAVLLISLGVVGLSLARRQQQALPIPSEFALMAVDTHTRRLRNQLPLEIVSDSPAAISGWFAGKVSFSLKLPNYQEDSGQDKVYRLEGARLVGFKNDYAALVAYQMGRHPITLVVTSNAVALPAGGEEITSKGLRFHYDALNGLKVITWADRGLTYALISDLAERGQQSCIVCHEGTKDRDFIEGLKPTSSAL